MVKHLRKTRKQKRKSTRRVRRQKSQRGGAAEAIIAVFTNNALTPDETEEVRTALRAKFTNVNNLEVDLSEYFKETDWGYKSLPRTEKKHVTYFEIENPPAYLMNTKCTEDNRLTKLEGEVDEAVKGIDYSLIPAQHGFTDGWTLFLVGMRKGKSGELSAITSANYLARC
jgi:hypothetical protein